MIIEDINIEKKTLRLNVPFKITYEEVREVEMVYIKLTDKKGNYGLGSASPDPHVTGETIEKSYELLKKHLTTEFFSLPLSHWYRYHEKIQTAFAGHPSAQSAVEEAVLSLFTQAHNLSLAQLFGGYYDSRKTMITLGIMPLEKTLAEAQKYLGEGFTTIKLKCGLNTEDDIAKIHALRKTIPGSYNLVLDANQGYSLAEAKTLLESIHTLNIGFIEEPVSAENHDDIKKVKQMNLVPIIADESAVSFKDILRLLKDDFVDGVNIKLMKCGGPVNFMKSFSLARSLQKITMIGCNYESNISLTTGAHLALALPIDYIDLDSGRLDFADDYTTGGMSIKNGIITIEDPVRMSN